MKNSDTIASEYKVLILEYLYSRLEQIKERLAQTITITAGGISHPKEQN